MSESTPRRPVPAPPPPTSRNTHGMTWPALVLLVLGIAYLGWEIYTWQDARTPPAGTTTQEATVEGQSQLGRASGPQGEDFVSIRFTLPGGEEGTALYERRWIGDHGEGEVIDVYRTDDGWRTTAEESPAGVVWAGLGILGLLALVGGWLVVRRRARASEPDV